MGLDQPLPVQFVLWLTLALQGDLGRSFGSGLPVLDLVKARLPATLELATAATLLTILIAIPAGVLAAVRRGRVFDQVVRACSAVLLAVPSFCIAILFILFFALLLDLLPPGGYAPLGSDPVANLRFLVLPAVALSLTNIGVMSRFVRTSMVEVLSRDYVRTARAKGLVESRVSEP
jgi:peptide/nickel transport system permease protein